MQFNSILLVKYLYVINKVLLSIMPDFENMEVWAKINDTIVIVNAVYFKTNEEIYIKITGYFGYTYIGYVFFDYLNTIDLTDPNIPKIKENNNKVENKNQYLDGCKLETRYYTIEKTSEHLKGIKE